MQIFVKTLNNTMALEVSGSDSVSSIKDQM